MRLSRFAPLLLLLLCLTLLPATAAGWTTYLGDSSNTAVADEAPLENATVGWEYTPDQNITSSPVFGDGAAYVGTVDGTPTVEGIKEAGDTEGAVVALNPTTGETLWSTSVEGGVFASPAVDDGVVYVGTLGGTVHALDSETGDEIWSTNVGQPVYGSPTVEDGGVYFGTARYIPVDILDEGFYTYRLDASDGTEDWSVGAEQGVLATPAVHDGTVYVGDQNGTMRAIDAETGDVGWEYESRNRETSDIATYRYGAFTSSPTVTDGSLYVSSYNGDLFSLDPSTGEFEWGFYIGAATVGSPTVVDSTAYVWSYGNEMFAIDTETGEERQGFAGGEIIASEKSPPAAGGGVLYAGSITGGLYAFNASTGERFWQLPTDSGVWSTPALQDGDLFFSSLDTVYMLETGDEIDEAFDTEGAETTEVDVTEPETGEGETDTSEESPPDTAWEGDPEERGENGVGEQGIPTVPLVFAVAPILIFSMWSVVRFVR